MSPAQTKGGFLANIRNQKWSVPVGMAITALLSLLLLLFTASWLCFAPILIALVMYFLPVFFGLKDKKKIPYYKLDGTYRFKLSEVENIVETEMKYA